jgi:hypothetical protein
MSKSERWALRTFVTDPKYSNWHVTLPGPQRRRLNAPGAIINAHNRAFPDPKKVAEREERREKELREKERQGLSPTLTPKEIEQLQARTAELEEELTAARAKGATEKTTAPRSLDAARAAYVRFVAQACCANQKALKAEQKQLNAELQKHLNAEPISSTREGQQPKRKTGTKTKTKTKTKTTKGRVIARVPGIGDIFEG